MNRALSRIFLVKHLQGAEATDLEVASARRVGAAAMRALPPDRLARKRDLGRTFPAFHLSRKRVISNEAGRCNSFLVRLSVESNTPLHWRRRGVCFRRCAGLRFSSEGGALLIRGGRLMTRYFGQPWPTVASPRPEAWLPLIFSSRNRARDYF